MTKLSERLRDWNDKWREDAKREAIEAADLLDECERAVDKALSRCSVCNDSGSGYVCPDCYDATITLFKLQKE